LKENTQAAFIIIQHQDPHDPHLAREVISRFTTLPVVEVIDGISLERGKIYLTPAHTSIDLEEEKFTVHPAENHEKYSVIDTSFRNLARDLGQKLVGVLLSGEGSDGSQGIKTIHDQGGMVIAQAPESAEHPAMPLSAVSTGVVDRVLRPHEIPTELSSYEKYVSRMFDKSAVANLRDEIGAALIGICEILQKETKHDFKHYKTSTLIRRIQRRMQVLQLNSVESYVERLQSQVVEVDSLFKELLINVTSFFRDPEAFEELDRDVLKPALENRANDHKFRVWVAGCSTGEEVYTFAILIKEHLEKLPHPPEVQIIATDIDEHALNLARKGVFSLTIEESVSRERLEKYFVRRGNKYHVSKVLRELCLFSSHNLINDPPFSQLDLISCRNVLIYLGTHLQKKLIPVFHYALKTNGYLFLGTSETLSSHRELFKIISAKHRIAQRKATAIRPQASFSTTLATVYAPHFKDAAQTNEADIHLVSQRIVLDEFAPKYAVVNDEGQIITVSSGLNEFLDPSEGVFQNNIVKMVQPSLRMGLRSTLAEAIKHKRRIDHETSTLKTGDHLMRIGLTVQPMPKLGEESSLYMVVFHRLGKLLQSSAGTSAGIDPQIAVLNTAFIDQLEQELLNTRQDLDKTVQDLEASNEELKSSNEELLSMNEELQSANEELETSKEEVQESSEAIQRSNNDLENLLASTQIATLFLDHQLRIKTFTPSITDIYRIKPADIGREISDFTSLATVMPPLPAVSEVNEAAAAIESDITLPNGKTYLRRVLPYRTHDEKNRGLVVTFIDMTDLRAAHQQLQENETRLEMMIRTSPSFMCLLSGPDYIFEQTNERYLQLLGRTDILGKTILEVAPEVKNQGYLEMLNQVRETGEPYIGTEVPILLQRTSGAPPEKRYLDFVYQPDERVDGKVDRIFVHGNDVTEKVLSRVAIENERENFRNLFKQTRNGLHPHRPATFV
jgi:two-component system CheB/CheR fusion protein